jgi:hypothetical protein
MSPLSFLSAETCHQQAVPHQTGSLTLKIPASRTVRNKYLFFLMGLGFELSFTLAEQVLYHLSHISS